MKIPASLRVLNSKLSRLAEGLLAIWSSGLRRLRRITGWSRDFGTLVWRNFADRQRAASSLVGDVLTLQLAITSAIGLFALGGLAWTSQTITERNLSRWASQWTSQLNELGAPLFVVDPSSAILDIERFVATYPEVAHVDWFGPNGQIVFSVSQEDRRGVIRSESLAPELVERLRSRIGGSEPQLVDDSRSEAGIYRLIGPIWSESFSGDALMSLASVENAPTGREVEGFVAVELDYSWYEGQLASRLAVGCLFLLFLLAVSWAGGRYVLQKALRPLTLLQQPLRDLARGEMSVHFSPSNHHEIQNIITTLQQTTRALEARDKRLSFLATHDSLTGLANRHAFVKQLRREIELLESSGKQSAVLFIDLDQFKYINDTCGHPAGDELLRKAARSIKATTRDTDVVARFGGDEFAVLARNVTRGQARRIGEKILQHMAMLTQVHENKVFHLQCSIGITLVGRATVDAHEAISQADIACHSAKRNGRNRLEVYKLSGNENRQMAREIAWVQKIRNALEHDGFALVYQPLLRISTGWTDHFEVLLRLRDGPSELVSPDAFLPAATRFGLLSDIDNWVLENAIKSLAELRTPRTNLNFSINMSGSIFESERFGKEVESLLRKYDVPPDAIIFEITEQTAVRFAAESDKQIALLRDIGCRFAVDDFGKGYSSFSYLRRLPVDYLKIDGSFVSGLESDPINQTLVQAIGRIAHAMRIETIAECVESAETLELLTELGIDYAQGNYIAGCSETPVDLDAPRLQSRRLRLSGRAS